MITWLRENTGLVSLAGAAVVVIATAAVGWRQLSDLVAAQPEIQRHMYDASRHIDPEEKENLEERIADLERRVRELEAQRWRQFIDRQRERRK
jgi:uncharacterized membrane protein YhiD involved in acid resistance